jgi:hypothetical protein
MLSSSQFDPNVWSVCESCGLFSVSCPRIDALVSLMRPVSTSDCNRIYRWLYVNENGPDTGPFVCWFAISRPSSGDA